MILMVQKRIMLADLLIYFKTGTTKVMVSSLKELIHGLGKVR